VVEASGDQESASAIRKQLAPVFSSTSKRKTSIFVKVRLTVDKNPKDPTGAARLKLKELGELFINQDPSAILYRYKQSFKDENDACTKLSSLPTTITGIQQFMNGFRPNPDGGDVWGNLRIGINVAETEFLDNVSQEAYMRKFWVRKAALQVAESENAGWLYLSVEAMDPEYIGTRINAYIKHACQTIGHKPFLIACERRMIWDDKAKSADLPIKERNAKKALHIVCEKGRAPDAALQVRAWLASPRCRALCNLPMKFIPNFSKGQGMVYNLKFGHAVQKHMKLTAFGTRNSTTADFDNLDSRCETLEGRPSLRKLMLAMKTRPKLATPGAPKPKPPTHVFLSIDASTKHSDRGQFVATYTIDNAVEAEEKLRNLLSYLMHSHGDSATYWFSGTAIERADHMKWDEVNQRPITVEEMDLDDVLDDDLDWVDSLGETETSFQPKVEVTLDRPSILRRISNNPLLGDADSVKTFNPNAVHPLPDASIGDTSDYHSATRVDTSIAGDSGESSAEVG
jgi:hypothetical protein